MSDVLCLRRLSLKGIPQPGTHITHKVAKAWVIGTGSSEADKHRKGSAYGKPAVHVAKRLLAPQLPDGFWSPAGSILAEYALLGRI